MSVVTCLVVLIFYIISPIISSVPTPSPSKPPTFRTNNNRNNNNSDEKNENLFQKITNFENYSVQGWLIFGAIILGLIILFVLIWFMACKCITKQKRNILDIAQETKMRHVDTVPMSTIEKHKKLKAKKDKSFEYALKHATVPSKSHTDLARMDLSSQVSVPVNEDDIIESYPIGTYIMGLYGNEWYKAKIVDILKPRDTYQVIFDGYDNKETLKYDDIKPINTGNITDADDDPMLVVGSLQAVQDMI